jgi:predicted phosphate transport protein (TIGR00153 family)
VTVASRAAPVLRLFGRAPNYSELLRLLRAAGANLERSADLLLHVMENWPDDEGQRHELVTLEHEGDRITHDIIHHLYSKAAIPFDRSDVLSLAAGLDDVVDYVEEVGDYLVLYRVEAPMEHAIELAKVLSQTGRQVAASLDDLDTNMGGLRGRLVEINRLEEEGDRISRNAIAALFEGGIDPMVVIRWKDIYERLEQGIDSCEHVAHVLEGVLVKRA